MPKQMTTEELFGKTQPKQPRQMSSQELFGQQQPKVEGGMDYGQSALHGALQGATFNYSDEAIAGAKALYDKLAEGKDFSEAYDERLERERAELERARKNPKSYIAGMAAGGMATAAIPGLGWANIGKGASVAGQMGKAALLGGLAGSGESEGNILENQGQLAKDVALGAGAGAAFQGLLGKGSEALKKLPAFARKKAAERAVKATTGQNIKAIRKMGGTTHASAGDIEKFEKGVRKVGEDIMEEVTPSGKPLMSGFESVEDLAPKMAEARKYYGGKLGEVGKAVDVFYPKGAVSGKSIANKLRAYAAEIPPVAQGKKLAEQIDDIAGDFDAAGNLTFDKAKLYKNQFQYKADDADLLVSNKDVTNKIRSIIGKEMDDVAEALSKKDIVKTKGNILTAEAADGYVVAEQIGDKAKIFSADLPEAVRGQGIGLGLYEKLIKKAQDKGLKVVSDETVELPAARVYEALRKRGYDVKLNPKAKLDKLNDGSQFWFAPKGESVFSIESAGKIDMPNKVDELKDLLKRYGQYKGKYGSFKQAADAATDRAQKNLSNRFVSPSDYGVGSSVGITSAIASGNPAMLLMGAAGAAANKLARERGSSTAAVALRKIAQLAENPAFSNKYAKALTNAAGDGPTAMLGVHAVLMKTDPDYKSFFKEEY